MDGPTRLQPAGVPYAPSADSLTSQDLCEILQVPRPVVQQLIRSGVLAAIKTQPTRGVESLRSVFEAWVQARYADTRAWISLSPPTAAGMWDRHSGGDFLMATNNLRQHRPDVASRVNGCRL